MRGTTLGKALSIILLVAGVAWLMIPGDGTDKAALIHFVGAILIAIYDN